jgi:hypothetical protein
MPHRDSPRALRPRPRLVPGSLLGAALPLLLALALGAGGPAARVARADPAAAPPVPLEDALRDLDILEKQIKSSRTINEELIASLNAVANAYHNLAEPAAPELQPIPDDADDDQKKAIEDNNKKLQAQFEKEKAQFAREKPKFLKDAIKQFLKALELEKWDPHSKTNVRDDVVIRAAQILGDTGDKDVADKIQAVLERKIFKRREADAPQIVLDEVFAALGKLNNPDTLKWMGDQFTHTKSSPQKEVDQLVAAQKAMVLFTDIPGKVRFDICKTMITNYSSVENQAEHGNPTDKNVQSAQAFWGAIKTGAIKAVQYLALEPTDEQGRALATMAEFMDWFRDNDNYRKPPWGG